MKKVIIAFSVLFITALLFGQGMTVAPNTTIFPGGVAGEPTFTDIQGGWGSIVSAGTTVSFTLTSNPTAGNAIVCGVSVFPNSSTLTSVVDNAGTPNNYTVSAHSPANANGSAVQMILVYLLNAPSGAGKTITATASATITFNSFIGCNEYHRSFGTWTIDTDVAGGGTTGTAVNNPSITSAVAGELEVGFANVQNGISTANTPWNFCSAGTTSSNVGGCEDILSSTGSSTAMNFTATATGQWNSMLAAFK